MKRSIIEKGFVFLCGSLFLGCSGQNAMVNLYPKDKSLSQERLFLVKKPFANSKQLQAKSLSKTIIDVVAPELVNNMIDVVGKSIIEISGKNNQTKTKSAKITDYFYQNGNYKTSNLQEPAYHMVFISGEFGEEKEAWRPVNFDTNLDTSFRTLNLVGKPKFYMEASIIPIANTQYMQVVPTYFFYNTHFNSSGMDQRRDLELRFSFSEIGAIDTTYSSGSIVLKDVKVGEEYGSKELAEVSTDYLMMPQVTSSANYSGGYTLRVDVTETRDINEWLASLGEIISRSKEKLADKLYVTQEQRIIRETALKKAKIEVRKIELQLEEQRTTGASEVEILELESQLLDKKAEANQLSIQYGKLRIY